MQAMVIRGVGDAAGLHLEEVPNPRPGPREVLVAVKAAALNRADLAQRAGRYQQQSLAGDAPLRIAGRLGSVARSFCRSERPCPARMWASMSDQAEIHPERLIGAWRLVEWRTQQVTGTIGHPFGPDAIGLIIYTQDGHMSGHLMHAHRPAFSRPRTQAVEFDAGDPTELAAAFNSYLAYGGGWTLEEDGLVRHHVVVASIPGWAGTTLIRRVHFAGEQLVLTTLPRTVDGVEQQGILRWERA